MDNPQLLYHPWANKNIFTLFSPGEKVKNQGWKRLIIFPNEYRRKPWGQDLSYLPVYITLGKVWLNNKHVKLK